MSKRKISSSEKNIFEYAFTKNNFIYLILFSLAVILFLSYNSRGWSDYFPGFESNYNQRIARQTNILNQEINLKDNLSIHNTQIHYNLYNLFLSFLSEFPAFYLSVINVILSLLLAFLFHKFLRDNHASKLVANIATLILIFSPIFIFYSISLSVVILFTIIVILSLLSLKKKYSVLTIFLALIVPLFGINFTVIYLFIILSYSIFINRIKYFYVIFGVVIGSALLIDHIFFGFSVFSFPSMTTYSLIRELISEFGGIRGISIMTFSLFGFGFMKLFFDKKKNVMQFLFLTAVISIFFFEYRFFFILNFAISVYAAYGLSHLIRRKWFSEDLKNLTILIILCGIAFTYLSFFGRFADIEPREYHISSLEFLAQQDLGVVFTIQNLSPYVQNIADMPIIIDSFSYNHEILSDIRNILHSQDLRTTISLLNKYDVKYIYIDETMKSTEWQHKEKGLLFVLSDRNNFELIFSDDFVSIWKLIPQDNG